MDRLWAPWRMEYIVSDNKPEGCIFCQFPAANQDEQYHILARSASAFVILNRFPYNNGHLMVIPFKHVPAPDKLSPEEQADLHGLLYKTVAILKPKLKPDGFNIGMNIGRVAGAGIADHCHYHIVPRWNGDTNFMPVLSETRVISEHLNATYKSLKPLFAGGAEEQKEPDEPIYHVISPQVFATCRFERNARFGLHLVGLL
jgi:ATP adenylyltransferase